MTAFLANAPVLQTDRFRLRAPEGRDFPVWQDFALSERAVYIGGGPEHDTGKAWRAFASLAGHWMIHGFGTFVVADRETDIALAGTGPWCPGDWPENEIGWTIWQPEWEGRGLMAEAVPVVLDHVFRDLGWATAVSYIAPANARSIALAERLGATRDDAAAHPGKDTLVYRHRGRSS